MFQFVQSVKNSEWVQGIQISQFFLSQILYLHPLTAIAWISGVFCFFFHREFKDFRVLGWIFLIVVVLLLAQAARLYYLLPIYPIYMASGSVVVERWMQRSKLRLLPHFFLMVLILTGILMAPAGLPILTAEESDELTRKISLGLIDTEHAPELFEMFRDMEGKSRKKMLEVVQSVYFSLSPPERKQATILAADYGSAGAINYYGSQYGLPQVISGNVNYYIWGPRGETGETTIAVGFHPRFLKSVFREVQDIPGSIEVKLCRYPVQPIFQLWPYFKSFPN
jgi:hypothetical protein